MYVGYTFIKQKHQRHKSVLCRTTRVYALLCDHCASLFFRSTKTIGVKRLTGDYPHYCGYCENKYKLAQKDSAKRKRNLKHDASSTVPISRLY